jgi:hypothetical protein
MQSPLPPSLLPPFSFHPNAGHWQASITGTFLWWSKTWSLPIYPSNQDTCSTQTNLLTRKPEYIFRPSSEYAFGLFEIGPSCSKA